MTREHTDGVDLRLAHRFESGYWVRSAATSKTLGIVINEGGVWHWKVWPLQPGASGGIRPRRAACAALVAWYREHDPDALTATPATTTEVPA